MEKEKKIKTTKISVQNRKASFEYELLEEFDAGIMLFGSEIKSIRAGNVSISEAYCYINNGEVFIRGMHIQSLTDAAVPHDPIRERKLLLTKKEINKIIVELRNKGLTLIPTYLHNKKGLAKLKINIAKGKKLFDKRESIKKKDVERDLKREEN